MRKSVLALLCIVTFLVAGCVPTEKYSIVDARPQISFKVVKEEYTKEYEVFIDNLFMGKAVNFLEGEAALRVIPGAHVVRVKHLGKVILEEKIYLGDGSAKTVVIH
jgi:hypothetical protein